MGYKSMVSQQLELKAHVLFALLATCFALTTNAQDQTGFISIDCGLQSNISRYNEKSTGLSYISDDKFIDSGEINFIAEKYRDLIQQQYWSLRSFPQGNRNCYNIEVTQGTKYLIRASFYYGDYDNQLVQLPEFDLHLGPNLWDSVKIVNSSWSIDKEIIHVPQLSRVQVCLVNTARGIPFISVIELRPLNNSAYNSQNKSLALYRRRDAGSDTGYRYGTGNDAHDRFWYSSEYFLWKDLNTSETVESENLNDIYNIPSIVMSTAATPKDPNASLDIWWPETDNTTTNRYYFFMHFAEIEKLGLNESREFNIFYNGLFFYGPVYPPYLRRTTIMTTNSFSGPNTHNFSLSMTQNSTHPPIINAFEIFTVKELPQSESDQQDVDAVTMLKSTYGLRRNWQGDPCAPKEYAWEGLTCSYDGPPRVISLNLSASELIGEIGTSISNLPMIEKLDLSNNNLTGSVPEFLSQLPNLKVLNLENNHLNGSVPLELIEKSNQGFLSLSINGNANLCASVACKKKKSTIPVVAISVAGIILLLLVIAAAWWALRRKIKNGAAKAKAESISGDYSLEPKKKKFTYSDIIQITNNFKKVIGKGGFGTVYHGLMGDTQVAVKILSASTVQGYQQFQAEVNILLRVYHRNLTTLVGYFTDENHAGLVYEYMVNGDLQSHLQGDADNSSGTTNNILKWEDRLRIAVDAGQGLEYLHQGCKPPIVHRDVKSANILLNESFQAKLSDFGISKTFPSDSKAIYVSTVVAGTPGYLDPEYYKSNRLNEKSDVYSFGILLLEIITGRPAMSKNLRNPHLGEWVSLMLEKGLIKSIIDPRLQGDFSLNSAWKVVEIAMNCVSSSSADRPTMGQVVGDLKVCLEMVQVSEAKETELGESYETIPLNFIADQMSVQPLAR